MGSHAAHYLSAQRIGPLLPAGRHGGEYAAYAAAGSADETNCGRII